MFKRIILSTMLLVSCSVSAMQNQTAKDNNSLMRKIIQYGYVTMTKQENKEKVKKAVSAAGQAAAEFIRNLAGNSTR